MLLQGRAPAKLNLALELTGRRADGYHLLEAVSQTIDWSDAVALRVWSGPGPAPRAPELRLRGPEAHRVPRGTENLALRAALTLGRRGLGLPIGSLALAKRVPTQSGLGGGSADAAAVLRLAGRGVAEADLEAAALECGADVPFSLIGGAARLAGVGEVLSPLPGLHGGAFLIAVLGRVATAAVYAATLPQDFSDGRRAARLAEQLRHSERPLPELLGSGLEKAAMRALPELARARAELGRAVPGLSWAMTGSGGAFFSFHEDPERASELASRVAAALPWALVRVALPLSGRPLADSPS